MRSRHIILALYLIFLMLPIYWLINMSFKTTQEITTGMTLVPLAPTLRNYEEIFTNPAWFNGFVFSLTYVLINTVISVAVALPAAYAFSRYRFLGDKHLFFWLLSNRMARRPCSPCPSSTSIRLSACSTRPGPSPWRIASSMCR